MAGPRAALAGSLLRSEESESPSPGRRKPAKTSSLEGGDTQKVPSPSMEHRVAGTPASSARLKTSKEVFDMVRNDPGYDAEKCAIVYHDRVADRYMRTSLADWTPASKQGDVPWHRVWFFTYNGTVFWDREQRYFDLPLLRHLACGGGPPTYQNVTRGAHSLAESLPQDFRIATLNLLVGRGDYRIPDLGSRLPGICQALGQLGADVIMMQECNTRAALEFLEHQTWVRERYEIVYSDLVPLGLITLARARHMRASQQSLPASNRKALKVCFQTATGSDVETWNVNLSAERKSTAETSGGVTSDGGETLRQLEQRTYISGCYPAIVAGDFSGCSRKDGVGPFSQDADRGWSNAWTASRRRQSQPVRLFSLDEDDRPTGSIHPEAGSKRTVAGRGDRIFVRSAQLLVTDIRQFSVNNPEVFEHHGTVVDIHMDPSKAVDDEECLGNGRR